MLTRFGKGIYLLNLFETSKKLLNKNILFELKLSSVSPPGGADTSEDGYWCGGVVLVHIVSLL